MPASKIPPRVAVLVWGSLVSALAACASDRTSAKSSAAVPAARTKSEPYVSQFALPGRRVYVEFHQASSGTTMALVNRGSTDPSKVYSEPRPTASLKVANDGYMADLCENFRRLGFQEMAEATPPADLAWSISLDVDGRVSTLYHVRNRAGEDPERRAQIQRVFLAVFNQTAALQTIENPDGVDLFRREQDRINAEAARKRTGAPRP